MGQAQLPSRIERVGTVPITAVVPPGTRKGGVVVFQDGGGVGDYMEQVVRSFAAEGYLTVAPHLYHRSGVAITSSGRAEESEHLRDALTLEGLLEDLDACLGFLEANDVPMSQTGLCGFCMGGTVAVMGAVERAPGAAVTFYGSGIMSGRFGIAPLVEIGRNLRAPWLGLFGDLDPMIPPEHVEALRRSVAGADVPAEIVRYPYAGHAFHCPTRAKPGEGGEPVDADLVEDRYSKEAAGDGWKRTLNWFDRYLGPGSWRQLFFGLTRHEGPRSVLQMDGQPPRLDDIDLELLRLLQRDARQTNKDLADAVGIAQSTCLERIRALRAAGVVRGWHADVDPAALGRPLRAMISVRLRPKSSASVRAFQQEMLDAPEVLAVWTVTGADDFLVEVATSDVAHLRDFVLDHVTARAEVVDARTALVYDQVRVWDVAPAAEVSGRRSGPDAGPAPLGTRRRSAP